MTQPDQPGLLSILVRPGHPDFLDLPWEVGLAAWPGATERSIELPRGLSRHEVQFVSYGGTSIYAVKELPEGMAEREYGLLLEMQARSLPSVEPVGHALAARPDGQRVSLLITKFLDASHPYRVLFLTPGLERYRERLLDAMAAHVRSEEEAAGGQKAGLRQTLEHFHDLLLQFRRGHGSLPPGEFNNLEDALLNHIQLECRGRP